MHGGIQPCFFITHAQSRRTVLSQVTKRTPFFLEARKDTLKGETRHPQTVPKVVSGIFRHDRKEKQDLAGDSKCAYTDST
eukprot:scaffold295512_cov13-Tisochrysis_lutea.AAC.1